MQEAVIATEPQSPSPVVEAIIRAEKIEKYYARRSGGRRLRPIPKTEGQEPALRRPRARRAVHHFDPRWHRHARDHSQMVRTPHLRAPVPEDARRGRFRRGHLR